MFRIEWLIRCGYSQGQQLLLAAEAKHFALSQQCSWQLNSSRRVQGVSIIPTAPHRNKLQMAPGERIARAAPYSVLMMIVTGVHRIGLMRASTHVSFCTSAWLAGTVLLRTDLLLPLPTRFDTETRRETVFDNRLQNPEFLLSLMPPRIAILRARSMHASRFRSNPYLTYTVSVHLTFCPILIPVLQALGAILSRFRTVERLSGPP
jgi:hypothetical protein